MSILSLYFLASNHPIKAMYLGVKFLFVLTPSPCGHSPYILLRKTQGGEGEMYIPFASASMLFKTSRHAAEYGRGRG